MRANEGVTALKVASVSEPLLGASIALVSELLIGQLCSASDAELHLHQYQSSYPLSVTC